MKEIKLTQGKVAIIDDDDFERVSQFKWTLYTRTDRKNHGDYARRTLKSGKNQKTIWLHRFIMDAPDKIEVDHKNRNGLDNQKQNLRLATRSQNKANQQMRKANTSGYRGVTIDSRNKNKKFYAQIGFQGKVFRFGGFHTAKEAAAVYNQKAVELFGEFAVLNELND